MCGRDDVLSNIKVALHAKILKKYIKNYVQALKTQCNGVGSGSEAKMERLCLTKRRSDK